jgi:hypothetical protein
LKKKLDAIFDIYWDAHCVKLCTIHGSVEVVIAKLFRIGFGSNYLNHLEFPDGLEFALTTKLL